MSSHKNALRSVGDFTLQGSGSKHRSYDAILVDTIGSCVLVLEQSKREPHLVETGSSGCCRSAALLHCSIPEDRAHSRILSAALRTRRKVRMKRALTSVPLDSNKCEGKKRKIRLRCPALMENPPVTRPPTPIQRHYVKNARLQCNKTNGLIC